MEELEQAATPSSLQPILYFEKRRCGYCSQYKTRDPDRAIAEWHQPDGADGQRRGWLPGAKPQEVSKRRR